MVLLYSATSFYFVFFEINLSSIVLRVPSVS